jgi:hypothetical protein
MGSWREYYRRNRNALNGTDIFSIQTAIQKKRITGTNFKERNFRIKRSLQTTEFGTCTDTSSLFSWLTSLAAPQPGTGIRNGIQLRAVTKTVEKNKLFCIYFFAYTFCRDRVYWPLLCLCRPFIIFEGYLDSNPE